MTLSVRYYGLNHFDSSILMTSLLMTI